MYIKFFVKFRALCFFIIILSYNTIALINLIASGIVIEMGAKYDEPVTNAYDAIDFINSNKANKAEKKDCRNQILQSRSVEKVQ